jgi:hypothetical protein
MKKFIYFPLAFIILITSCKKPIEKADEIFTDEGASFLGNDIVFFSSTIDFYHHGVLSNYWYPDDATYKDILNDKYHQGYKGLTNLNEESKNIDTKDKDVSAAINDLQNQIEIAQKNLKKKQKLLEALDVFGGSSFGGADVLEYDSSSEKEKNIQVPKNVEKSFNALLKLIRLKYSGVAESIFNLERRAFMISQPNEQEKGQIRDSLKIFIKNKIDVEYKEDSPSKKEMEKLLFEIFEKEHPIDYDYKPV